MSCELPGYHADANLPPAVSTAGEERKKNATRKREETVRVKTEIVDEKKQNEPEENAKRKREETVRVKTELVDEQKQNEPEVNAKRKREETVRVKTELVDEQKQNEPEVNAKRKREETVRVKTELVDEQKQNEPEVNAKRKREETVRVKTELVDEQKQNEPEVNAKRKREETVRVKTELVDEQKQNEPEVNATRKREETVRVKTEIVEEEQKQNEPEESAKRKREETVRVKTELVDEQKQNEPEVNAKRKREETVSVKTEIVEEEQKQNEPEESAKRKREDTVRVKTEIVDEQKQNEPEENRGVKKEIKLSDGFESEIRRGEAAKKCKEDEVGRNHLLEVPSSSSCGAEEAEDPALKELKRMLEANGTKMGPNIPLPLPRWVRGTVVRATFEDLTFEDPTFDDPDFDYPTFPLSSSNVKTSNVRLMDLDAKEKSYHGKTSWGRIVRAELWGPNCGGRTVGAELWGPNCGGRTVRAELWGPNCGGRTVGAELSCSGPGHTKTVAKNCKIIPDGHRLALRQSNNLRQLLDRIQITGLNHKGHVTSASENPTKLLQRLRVQNKIGANDGTELSVNRDIAHQLFEGDILLTRPQAQQILREMENEPSQSLMRRMRPRQLNPDPNTFWTETTIPFTIAGMQNDVVAQSIFAAHRHISSLTCIRFAYYQDANALVGRRDYMEYSRLSGCWSMVGRLGGSQIVSIGFGCETIPGPAQLYQKIINSFSWALLCMKTLHALGIWHEQSRTDQENYVTINYNNILSGTESNFYKRSPDTSDNLGQPYVYSQSLLVIRLTSYTMGYRGRPFFQEGRRKSD
ncbi:hypothetical protein niasHT_019149 [Heterodera trifolii]|uniref:Metalloendopeptidase n=1 Tax=Heterodera trifolii TaxID=157864 RepID=A0ABD2L7G1_9BILA